MKQKVLPLLKNEPHQINTDVLDLLPNRASKQICIHVIIVIRRIEFQVPNFMQGILYHFNFSLHIHYYTYNPVSYTHLDSIALKITGNKAHSGQSVYLQGKTYLYQDIEIEAGKRYEIKMHVNAPSTSFPWKYYCYCLLYTSLF